MLVWWLYAEAQLQLIDLRVWLACFEMAHRRTFLGEGRQPAFQRSELSSLLANPHPARLRASLKRLEAISAVRMERSRLVIAKSPRDLADGVGEGFAEWFAAATPNTNRTVPMPRRLLRFIVGGTTRVETAVLLAIVTRCIYQAGKVVSATGNLKASWVSSTFGVNATSVKMARSRLEKLGLISTQETPQWHRNRYGSRVTLNLAFRDESTGMPAHNPADNVACTESRPPSAQKPYENATPIGNQDLHAEGKHQNPAAQARSGVCRPKPQKPGITPSPTLRHLVEEDLRDVGRLLTLHQQAVAARLAPAGERGELEFIGLAEHARAYATKNAPGLLAWLLRHAKWRHITGDDEDQARQRLREHRFAVAPKPSHVVEQQPKPVADLLAGILAAARPVVAGRPPSMAG